MGTLLEEMQESFTQLAPRLKEEKRKSGMTNQEIADATGIPLSNLGKFFSSTLERPSVYNVACVCKLLGVSMDDLFGLPNKTPTETQDSSRAALNAAERMLTHSKQIIWVLLCVCAILACTLILYIFIDKGIEDAGLFQAGYTSPFGVAVIILLFGSVAAIVHGITRAMK